MLPGYHPPGGGSPEAFAKVDHIYVAELARLAAAHGVPRFVLVSAVGADPSSPVFYNRVKGRAEAAVSELPFKTVHLLRPSLLLGEHREARPVEAGANGWRRSGRLSCGDRSAATGRCRRKPSPPKWSSWPKMTRKAYTSTISLPDHDPHAYRANTLSSAGADGDRVAGVAGLAGIATGAG
ncbi:MAG: hypothetical protein R3F44_04250 [Candidatus Competibacteraceae bacterium]